MSFQRIAAAAILIALSNTVSGAGTDKREHTEFDSIHHKTSK
jgi:hypothetical protein